MRSCAKYRNLWQAYFERGNAFLGLKGGVDKNFKEKPFNALFDARILQRNFPDIPKVMQLYIETYTAIAQQKLTKLADKQKRMIETTQALHNARTDGQKRSLAKKLEFNKKEVARLVPEAKSYFWRAKVYFFLYQGTTYDEVVEASVYPQMREFIYKPTELAKPKKQIISRKGQKSLGERITTMGNSSNVLGVVSRFSVLHLSSWKVQCFLCFNRMECWPTAKWTLAVLVHPQPGPT